jgi:predicted esterase
MPIAIFVGKNDELFPLPLVRATRDALNAHGFNSELTEIAGHTHWYYDRAPEINRSAWAFLKSHELADEPKFEHHQFSK